MYYDGVSSYIGTGANCSTQGLLLTSDECNLTVNYLLHTLPVIKIYAWSVRATYGL